MSSNLDKCLLSNTQYAILYMQNIDFNTMGDFKNDENDIKQEKLNINVYVDSKGERPILIKILKRPNILPVTS